MNEYLKSIQSLLTQKVDKEALFEKARQVRSEHFNNSVFAYGFNYFSTYCSKQCAFCLYREGNTNAPRYRNEPKKIVDTARRLADTGVHLIDLTMGEDQYYLSKPERLTELISSIHEATQLPVMISPGLVDPAYYASFKQAGATWFALYQETFESPAYARLRLGQDFDERIKAKRHALRAGLLIEEGILTGWGDTEFELAHSVLAMEMVYPSQFRIMTFVPQQGTPMEQLDAQNNERELIIIAVMRLLFPDKLIPATLDVEGPAGLEARLNAGANVITSLVPPHAGMVGVSSRSDIDNGARSLTHVMPIIVRCGLKLASQTSYRDFVHKEQTKSQRLLQSTGEAECKTPIKHYQELAEAG